MANEDFNAALDWNDAVEEQVFENLPEADYNFQVIGFEREHYNGGEKMGPCPIAVIKIKVDGGELYGQRELTHRLFLHKKMQGRLFEFFGSIGAGKTADGKIIMDWNQVNGKKGRCRVGKRVYQGKEYNEVKKFIPATAQAPQYPQSGQNWTNGGF